MTKYTNITIRALLEAAKYRKKCLHCKEEITGVRAYSAKTKYCSDVCRTEFYQLEKYNKKVGSSTKKTDS